MAIKAKSMSITVGGVELGQFPQEFAPHANAICTSRPLPPLPLTAEDADRIASEDRLSKLSYED